jgi:hypothetical protein
MPERVMPEPVRVRLIATITFTWEETSHTWRDIMRDPSSRQELLERTKAYWEKNWEDLIERTPEDVRIDAA